MTCEFTHLDGAYLLGALSPGERQQFEAHLAGCAECTRAVGELAGLPGLLARVGPEDLGTTNDVPMPDNLLPDLIRACRRSERRRGVVIAVLSAAAVIAAAAGLFATGVVGDAPTPDAGPAPSSSPSAVPGRAMVAVGKYAPVTASLDVVGVLWGTRLDLTCSYETAAADLLPQPGTYVMVVHTREGRTQQVATWRALPGRTMHLSGAPAPGEQDNVWVEVRTSSGDPVLRLTT